tara:strand:- start:590 stop:2686 length:2097 start_codon:yes stop_codon:yes gene_type:complete
MKRKVLVEAPALTQSGYGEHSRLVLRALREREEALDIYLECLDWGRTSWILEESDESRWINSLRIKTANVDMKNVHFDLHIRVGILNEFTRKGDHCICVTAGIETTKVSENWIAKSHEVDKIVVPSEFSKWVFENTSYMMQVNENEKRNVGCGSQIDVINYPIKTLEKDENFKLDLPCENNYLIVSQWSTRKNMENCITWFLEEFKNDNVGLVIKTNLAKNCHFDKVATVAKLEQLLVNKGLSGSDVKCKIHLLHGDLTQEEMNSLYCHPGIKGLITATHGEGYGLPLFEAAYNGLPVLAPGWSGHLDFLYGHVKDKKGKSKRKPLFLKVDYTLSHVQKQAVWKDVVPQNSMWCFPSERDFKKKLRLLHNNYGMYASWAKKLKKILLETHTERNILDNLQKSLLPESLLKDPDYIFVSDLFANQYSGGAELTFQSLINKTPSDKIGAVNSELLDASTINRFKDCKWVFGNISKLKDEVLDHLLEANLAYSVVEFDYKFCKHRNPELYNTVEGERCDYKNTEKGQKIASFLSSAEKVFFMSESQRSIHHEEIDYDAGSNSVVLSSVFSQQSLNYIKELREKHLNSKNNKWIVLGSNSWVKGASESEEWCKENNLDYEVVWGLQYGEFLEKLAMSKGICFLPQGMDTCPRFVIEAKLLGCDMELNDNVQHSKEDWWNKDVEEIFSYLENRADYFWSRVFE